MGKIVAVVSGKGGVGKSTVTANTSMGLALEGKKVLAIDFDIGLKNLDMILGLERRIVYNVVDVMEGRANLNQAIVKSKTTENLHFLPASQKDDKNVLSKEKVKNLIEPLKEEYDFIIIDSPAGIESGFEHAIMLAEMALVVVNPEISAIKDADRVVGLIDSKSEYAREGKEVDKKLIINRIRPEMVESGDMFSINDVQEFLGLPIIGLIPEDEEIITSTNNGVPIVLNNKSETGKEYRNIAKRILGEKIPLPSLKKKGFLKRILGI